MKKSFVVFTLLAASTLARADEITVSAAASLKPVFTRIAADFAKVRPQTQVRFNFGSSGTLQSQIENGAPVDVFASASDKNMGALQSANLLEPNTRQLLARGELVLVAPRASKFRGLSDLRRARTVAIGGPGVPAGDYARQTLAFYKLDKVVAPRLIYAKDVRGVLALVASGNADAGFVYRSDALSSREVRVVAAPDSRSHAPVRYSFAVIKNSQNKTSAREWMKFCLSSGAQSTLRRFGFQSGR